MQPAAGIGRQAAQFESDKEEYRLLTFLLFLIPKESQTTDAESTNRRGYLAFDIVHAVEFSRIGRAYFSPRGFEFRATALTYHQQGSVNLTRRQPKFDATRLSGHSGGLASEVSATIRCVCGRTHTTKRWIGFRYGMSLLRPVSYFDFFRTFGVTSESLYGAMRASQIGGIPGVSRYLPARLATCSSSRPRSRFRSGDHLLHLGRSAVVQICVVDRIDDVLRRRRDLLRPLADAIRRDLDDVLPEGFVRLH